MQTIHLILMRTHDNSIALSLVIPILQVQGHKHNMWGFQSQLFISKLSAFKPLCGLSFI